MLGQSLRWAKFAIVGVALLLQASGSIAGPVAAPTAATAPVQVEHLKITVLSTNVAGDFRGGEGEWGYAALVEVDGKQILYDTGGRPGLVLENARLLHVDLSKVETVVLSHNHPDHTGGLMSLREGLVAANPSAMSVVHAGAGIFAPRYRSGADKDLNGMTAIKADYERSSGRFVVHSGPEQIMPGVWLTGPVPRVHREHASLAGVEIPTPQGREPDAISEDSALIISTRDGIVILTGCGHAGIVNIVEYARRIVGRRPILAVIGGLHLAGETDRQVDWTGAQLKRYGVRYLLAGHCTGFEATIRLRHDLGLSRRDAVVSTVGSSFTLGKGVETGELAQ